MIFYVFQTFMRSWRPMTGIDYEISTQMANYWAGFIKCGDPNRWGEAQWLPYNDENKGYLVIDKEIGMRYPAPSKRAQMLTENIIARVCK